MNVAVIGSKRRTSESGKTATEVGQGRHRVKRHIQMDATDNDSKMRT